jgi:hypothetical protein
MRWVVTLFIYLLFSTAASAQPRKEESSLVFDPSDLLIIKKADSILSDSLKWNKQDDRECVDDIASGKYSLFCALYKASIDVTGTYEHRRAAMQQVRIIVEKHDIGHKRAHRLMDWNNSPETTFAMLKAVLRESIETVKKKLK